MARASLRTAGISASGAVTNGFGIITCIASRRTGPGPGRGPGLGTRGSGLGSGPSHSGSTGPSRAHRRLPGAGPPAAAVPVRGSLGRERAAAPDAGGTTPRHPPGMRAAPPFVRPAGPGHRKKKAAEGVDARAVRPIIPRPSRVACRNPAPSRHRSLTIWIRQFVRALASAVGFQESSAEGHTTRSRVYFRRVGIRPRSRGRQPSTEEFDPGSD